MSIFYFKLDDDIIRDVIEYEHEGYTQVELPMTHLPAGINAGHYRWDGNTYTVDTALKREVEWSGVNPLQEIVDQLLIDNINMQQQIDTLTTSNLEV